MNKRAVSFGLLLAALPFFGAPVSVASTPAPLLVTAAAAAKQAPATYPAYKPAPTAVEQEGPLGILTDPVTHLPQINNVAPICTLDEAIAAANALQAMINAGAKGFPKQTLTIIEVNAQTPTEAPDPKQPISASNPPQAFTPGVNGYFNLYPDNDSRREYAVQVKAQQPVSSTPWTFTWDLQPWYAEMSRPKGIGAPGAFVSKPLPASSFYAAQWVPAN